LPGVGRQPAGDPAYPDHQAAGGQVIPSFGGYTADTTGTDIAGMARAAGIARATTVRTIPEFVAAFDEARAAGEMATIVAKVEAINIAPRFVTDLPLLENRFQFQRHLREIRTAGQGN